MCDSHQYSNSLSVIMWSVLAFVLCSRITFVPMVQKDLHLERASLCDVFLDTLLVNAHTVGLYHCTLAQAAESVLII